ncbi:hypothetical protein GCM10020369_49220 [Cryptosporangium minutisporangium]|uniref:Uncharacterized protein n=1 Tax=Cryptosporangium minutisporangium TaxID=113569 RepID=A0ABP6T3H3_9ACTN
MPEEDEPDDEPDDEEPEEELDDELVDALSDFVELESEELFAGSELVEPERESVR